jgi:hypothetical protein
MVEKNRFKQGPIKLYAIKCTEIRLPPNVHIIQSRSAPHGKKLVPIDMLVCIENCANFHLSRTMPYIKDEKLNGNYNIHEALTTPSWMN